MTAIRNCYSEFGVDNYYKFNADNYSNPHYSVIKELISDISIPQNWSVLDLCCGGGEITNCLSNSEITGCDPYTFNLYEKNTDKPCYRYDFRQIAMGALSYHQYDLIVCSFALHLCPKSLLNQVVYQLSLISPRLIILTPNKRPEIGNYWELEEEKIKDRVRIRIYERR